MFTATKWFCHFTPKLIILTNLEKLAITWIFKNQTVGVSVPVKVSGVLFRHLDYFVENLPLVYVCISCYSYSFLQLQMNGFGHHSIQHAAAVDHQQNCACIYCFKEKVNLDLWAKGRIIVLFKIFIFSIYWNHLKWNWDGVICSLNKNKISIFRIWAQYLLQMN